MIDVLTSKFSPLFLLPENQSQLEHVQRMRGIALFELGRPDEARPILAVAATRETERGRTLYYLARCYYELRDFERSKQCFREALELNLDPVYQASAHYLLGLIHYAQGQCRDRRLLAPNKRGGAQQVHSARCEVANRALVPAQRQSRHRRD